MHGAMPGGAHFGHPKMLADFRRRFVVSVIITVPILALTPEVQTLLGFQFAFAGSDLLLLLLSSVVYFYGGYPFLKGIFEELGKRQPGMMTLIAIAISVAYFYSAAAILTAAGSVFFWELATLIDIMLLGHWVEMRSVLGASRALEELVKIMPSEAHLLSGDTVREVKVEELKPGDRVVVKPGEKVPIDGTVVDGETSVNQSMLTGESIPVPKRPGESVIGGAINGDGSITLEVRKIGKETYLNQVIELVRRAQESKSKTQDLANRAALVLVLVALSVGSITFLAWLLAGQSIQFAIERAVTVMVICCPHALGLAIPVVVAVSTALAAKSGLLIRDRQAFERARELEAIVFDKTGTLTMGRFGVTDVIRLSDVSETEIIGLASSLEQLSEHPIAKGVVDGARERGLELSKVEGFRAIPGKGVEGS
ncbi:MAG: heavy metal translocating P-type ATPase, partial [Methanomassiliicoccales archaeon]|nr:heavy metal translocating P-type ATPase [Methanomassiliicoccales archaeon]